MVDWLRQHAPWLTDTLLVAAVSAVVGAMVWVCNTIYERIRWLWNLGTAVDSLTTWREEHSRAADGGFQRIGALEGRIAHLSGQFRVVTEGQAAMDRRATEGLARIEARLDKVTEQTAARIEGLEDRIVAQFAVLEGRSDDNTAAVMARIDGLYKQRSNE